MNIRPITENDFPEIFAWFEGKKWPLPPVEGIGPRQGMIAQVDGQAVACLWVYINGTAVADIEWVGVNPKVDSELGMKGVSRLIDGLKDWTKLTEGADKVRALRLFTKSEWVIKLFHEAQFKKATEYTRLLWVQKE